MRNIQSINLSFLAKKISCTNSVDNVLRPGETPGLFSDFIPVILDFLDILCYNWGVGLDFLILGGKLYVRYN